MTASLLFRNCVIGCCVLAGVLCLAHVAMGNDEVVLTQSQDQQLDSALEALKSFECATAAKILQDITEMTPKAEYAFGWCYSVSGCLEQNPQKAFRYFMQSAQHGYAPAQQAVGSCYKKGFGVAINLEKAVNWYTKAAKKGLDEAQYLLAERYCSGNGVKQNYGFCRDWLKKAAEQGYVKAMRVLGQLYEKNPAKWKDTGSLARHWYKQAAEQGDASAAYTLSQLVAREEKYQEVRHWIRVAAENGHALAQWNMAGFAKEPEEVLLWADRAARNGYLEACTTLADYYMKFSPSQAAEYLRIAADRGDVASKVRLARLANADKKSELLGMELKGATQAKVEGHLKKFGIKSEGAAFDGAMRYSASALQLADSRLVWMAYKERNGVNILSGVTYELPRILATKEDIAAYIEKMSTRFGTPYGVMPERIDPEKEWKVLWALPDSDVTLEYTPEKGMQLVMVPVS
ncbi:tetratricopeptide repeat protein [Halodesulfovibrio spirochaetisodalis]|uniref:Beta-lactamase n=1 Tax=Halodesulfovibrio spirochaetisodalis TaxID=1560234 RepID=A0A1B7XQ24_9BACT|nr:tetratricopeptide repeat protein [Halodesulfovibrio spirochaetisodalis]OBQ57620.1 hypothetical protein SP90_00845 [Halodesulfovibrio spirochaetisodalis]